MDAEMVPARTTCLNHVSEDGIALLKSLYFQADVIAHNPEPLSTWPLTLSLGSIRAQLWRLLSNTEDGDTGVAGLNTIIRNPHF